MSTEVSTCPSTAEGPTRRNAPYGDKQEQSCLPNRAKVVIVGAGVIGASVAYHLTKLGCHDVLVLERKSIGCGTSWHSQGLVGLMRASPTLLKMAMETGRMIDEVEAISGLSTGYSIRGSLNVTAMPERMMQFRRFADFARVEGLNVKVVDSCEARRIYPYIAGDDLLGGVHIPTEGQVNALDLTYALLGAARKGGARVIEQVNCTGVQISGGRILAVDTDKGIVECDTLVNCTGLWGRDFLRSEMGGLPLQAVEHNFLTTEFSEDIEAGLPMMRDPDLAMTIREDARQLSVGFNEESVANIFAEDSVPESFEFDELSPNLDSATSWLERAINRVPVLGELGIRHFMCGPESITPDTRCLLGPWGLPNAFVAAGFSGVGVGSSGGAGHVLAHWIVNGAPPYDIWDVDIRRMMPFQLNRTYLCTRAPEASGKLFSVHGSNHQHKSARGIRRSPLHGYMTKENAVFRQLAGWEVADWFARTSDMANEHITSEESQLSWKNFAHTEVAAAKNRCAISDQTALAKFLIVGLDAGIALSHELTRSAPAASGDAVISAMLNTDGGIEAIFNVIKCDENEFMLIADSVAGAYLLLELKQRLRKWPSVSVVDVTSAYAVLDVIGPHAEKALKKAGWRGSAAQIVAGSADLSAEIGLATAVLCSEERLGVCSWRIIVATEFAQVAFEALQGSDGNENTLLGRYAYRYLRTSAGSPFWGEAINRFRTPLESGLGSIIDLSSGLEFTGYDVCVRQAKDGVTRLPITVKLQEDGVAALLGHEPIYIDGELKGFIAQGAYDLSGDSVAGIGIGYLKFEAPTDHKYCTMGYCEVKISGSKIKAHYEIARSKNKALWSVTS